MNRFLQGVGSIGDINPKPIPIDSTPFNDVKKAFSEVAKVLNEVIDEQKRNITKQG